MTARVKVLIVGGYGNFGGRLVDLLADEPRLTLVVAGRSLEKAGAFCQEHSAAKAELLSAHFDRNGGLKGQLSALAPDILVDATGPFQDYGQDGYRLIEACIDAGVHYLDFADGADFVAGVTAFDEAADAAGIFVLSGVSTFPVLPALAVRALSSDLASIQTIRAGLAPSPYAGIGETVIRAVIGYAGKPIQVRKGGTEVTCYPFTETLRATIGPPGRLPLKNRLFSLIDVPDLKLLPEIWPEVKTVWIGVGTLPEVLHRALIAASWLVRWKILPSLSPLARLITFVMKTFRWGEPRSGMFVEVTGRDAQDRPCRSSWHLLAEGLDGPVIPSMASAAIVRKHLSGSPVAVGAGTAIDHLSLEDYAPFFAGRAISTGVWHEEPKPTLPLHQQILGSSWNALPLEIRRMHEVEGLAVAEGRARVERGRSPLARLAALVRGFPKTGQDVPLRVEFTATDQGESWTRRFGDASFTSVQFAGRGTWQKLLVERFGPLRFAMALVPEEDGRLRLILKHWSAFGIPLPLWLAPRSNSFESAEDGRFCFNVEISHPFAGKIVSYKGWLERVS